MPNIIKSLFRSSRPPRPRTGGPLPSGVDFSSESSEGLGSGLPDDRTLDDLIALLHQALMSDPHHDSASLIAALKARSQGDTSQFDKLTRLLDDLSLSTNEAVTPFPRGELSDTIQRAPSGVRSSGSGRGTGSDSSNGNAVEAWRDVMHASTNALGKFPALHQFASDGCTWPMASMIERRQCIDTQPLVRNCRSAI